MTEWKDGKGDFTTWSHLCHWVKANLIHHDWENEATAISTWKDFLECRRTLSLPKDFPRATANLYKYKDSFGSPPIFHFAGVILLCSVLYLSVSQSLESP